MTDPLTNILRIAGRHVPLDELTAIQTDLDIICDRYENAVNPLKAALEEIIRREATSEYASIYSAPSEFARIAKKALGRP